MISFMVKTISSIGLSNWFFANAVFSFTSGLSMVLWPTPWAGLMGWGVSVVYVGLGSSLLLFAGVAAWLAFRKSPPHWLSILVVGGDWLWILASSALLVVMPGSFSASGRLTIVLIGGVVALFALGQSICLDHRSNQHRMAWA